MKRIALIAIMPLLAMAETVEMPKTPKPRYADCEESVTKQVALWKEGARTVTITIECDCTSSNALRVTLGKDADKDGKLAWEEKWNRFGWEATGWSLGALRNWNDAHEAVKIEKERRTLKVEFKLDAKGELVGFSAWDGKQQIFKSLSKTLPKWLYSKDWDIVQVKRNGVDDPNERVTISIEPQSAQPAKTCPQQKPQTNPPGK